MATAKNDDGLLVAAIDLGTTFSGYAFSFRHDFNRDPMVIQTNVWPGYGSNKTPTALLLKKNKEFDSFGHQAEEKYCQLSEEDEHHGWYFFRRFKMRLHKEGLKKTTELKDEEGKSLPAVDVFKHVICFLKDHLLKEINNRCPNIEMLDISWVITVPAIWNDAAKQFMRLAANKAGIKSEKLTLALEPEAASIYCKLIPVQRMTNTSGKDILACFQAGYKYLIADLGGGTADMTVHQVMSDFNLQEIHKPSGGDWGGLQVDDEFLIFLDNLFGPKVMEEFRGEFKADFLDLTRDFEAKKKKLGESNSGRVVLRIPVPLTQLLKDKRKLSLVEAIAKSNYKDIKVKGDRIMLQEEIVEEFFKNILKNIVDYIVRILQDPKCSDIKMILMVGGFSESPLVRKTIRAKFEKNMRVIVPQDAGMSVLKGAVLFGHAPNVVAERICKRTYGIDMHYDFIEGKHSKAKKVEIDGIELCKDIFEKFVTVGDSIRLGETKSHDFYNTFESSDRKKKIEKVRVYTSLEKMPQYVTDKTCNEIGTIELKPPAEGWPDTVEGRIEMQFGGTEFKVRVIDEVTKKEFASSFDFLG